MARKADPRLTYDGLLALSVKSAREKEELWCVYHPDGPLRETASADFFTPIRIACLALMADWDTLREQGFYLGRIPENPK